MIGQAAKGPETIPAMFDRIARQYDLLNRLLSLRRDVAWRRRLVSALPARSGLRVLDLATGTADVLVELARGSGPARFSVGIDASGGMLAISRRKLARRASGGAIHLVQGDLTLSPLRDASFDAVTIAFGIRNMADPQAALGTMHCLLKPGGRALVLEFSIPDNRLLRALYLLYLRHVLPRVGGMISGDAGAYRYLNRSIEAFPAREAFRAMLEKAGFRDIDAYPLTGGIATLYIADRT